MAWLAVDITGEESIFSGKPYYDVYTHRYGSSRYVRIKLPRGTIAKILGRELKWSDDPVEIKDKLWK